MKTKHLVTLALLVGIGAVLHIVIPGIGQGMKPDMMLTMMFLGILLFPDKKSVLLLGISTGVISGLTSTFPGGLLPNIIDKIITSLVFFVLYLLLRKYSKSVITASVLTVLGTLISGTVFLGSAYLIVSLPLPFPVLFITIVLPAAVLNTIVMIILYPIATSIFKNKSYLQEKKLIVEK